MLHFTARLVAILASLPTAIAAHAARESRARATTWLGALAYQPAQPANPLAIPPLATERWTLLWHRLGRMANRFQALLQRFQANTLPAPRPSRAGQPARQPGTPRLALPRAHGWVNHRIPESAPCTGQLADLLLDPALPAFLARAPQAGRLLRPLCRALGVPLPPCLALPPRPRPARSRPATPAPESASDRPLPAYVRAAARAWRKYDR